MPERLWRLHRRVFPLEPEKVMSLSLERGTEPRGLEVIIVPTGPGTARPILLGGYKISLEDFLLTAEYVLTSGDLAPDDLRLKFVESVRSMRIVEGGMPGGTRLESSESFLQAARPQVSP